jgi:hypothetical protein
MLNKWCKNLVVTRCKQARSQKTSCFKINQMSDKNISRYKSKLFFEYKQIYNPKFLPNLYTNNYTQSLKIRQFDIR